MKDLKIIGISGIITFINIMLLLMLSDSFYVLIFTIAIWSSIGVVGLLYLIFMRPDLLKFSYILAISILLGYGVGSLGPLLYNTEISVNFSDVVLFSNSFATIIFTVLLLFLYGKLIEKNPILFFFKNRLIAKKQDIFFLYLMLLIVIFYVLYGSFAVSPIQRVANIEAQNTNVSILDAYGAVFVLSIFPLGLALFIETNRRYLKFIILIPTIIDLIILLSISRGRVLFGLTTGLIILHLVLMKKHVKFNVIKIAKRVFFVSLIIIPIAYFAMKWSTATKYVVDESLPGLERTTTALNLVLAKDDRINERLQSTLENRTFILKFYSLLQDTSFNKEPLLGGIFIESVKKAIPRIFGITKAPFSSDGLVMIHFGLPLTDEADSILTAGVSDFGFIGAIFYPIFLILLIEISWSFIQNLRSIPIFFKYLCFSSYISLLLGIEIEINGYFSNIRNIFVLLFVIAVINYTFKPRKV